MKPLGLGAQSLHTGRARLSPERAPRGRVLAALSALPPSGCGRVVPDCQDLMPGVTSEAPALVCWVPASAGLVRELLTRAKHVLFPAGRRNDAAEGEAAVRGRRPPPSKCECRRRARSLPPSAKRPPRSPRQGRAAAGSSEGDWQASPHTRGFSFEADVPLIWGSTCYFKRVQRVFGLVPFCFKKHFRSCAPWA